jgi:2-polyprenyl-6-methoxyphenol hydroxylase-like FAD-dependent oxidoreductase
MLIGADGANSRVRKQYLPHAQRVAIGVASIESSRQATTPNRIAREVGKT